MNKNLMISLGVEAAKAAEPTSSGQAAELKPKTRLPNKPKTNRQSPYRYGRKVKRK